MRIVDLLSKESIMLNGTPKTKSEAIEAGNKAYNEYKTRKES